MQVNDIINIGPFQYRVIQIIGSWVTFEFKAQGILKQVSLKVESHKSFTTLYKMVG